jgi:hypothetical protein
MKIKTTLLLCIVFSADYKSKILTLAKLLRLKRV